MRVLAVSGSLRARSSNTILVRAAARLAPDEMEIVTYAGLEALPHFNPDLDGELPLPTVLDWRNALRAAHGVVVSSPEYAHGVPGALKNALDWIVGSGELVLKPVLLLNASSQSQFAQASLVETLSVMMAAVVTGGPVTVPLDGRKLGEDEIVADIELATAIRHGLAALAASITTATEGA